MGKILLAAVALLATTDLFAQEGIVPAGKTVTPKVESYIQPVGKEIHQRFLIDSLTKINGYTNQQLGILLEQVSLCETMVDSCNRHKDATITILKKRYDNCHEINQLQAEENMALKEENKKLLTYTKIGGIVSLIFGILLIAK